MIFASQVASKCGRASLVVGKLVREARILKPSIVKHHFKLNFDRSFSVYRKNTELARIATSGNTRAAWLWPLRALRRSRSYFHNNGTSPLSSDEDIAQYIVSETEVTIRHLTPEIPLHLLTPSCSLWHAREEDCLVEDPFWAFYWPGGQALTRYVLDNPSTVSGKVVLDVGSGCGASAVAASIKGAQRAVANDICKVAAVAARLNAGLNKVNIETETSDLIGQLDDQWDVVFLGDMFYDESFTNRVFQWMKQLHQKGKRVLIGDPGRIYFLKNPLTKQLSLLAQYELPEHARLENNGLTQGYVWTFGEKM